MMTWMSMELVGSMNANLKDLGLVAGHVGQADYGQALIESLIQLDLNGPDIHPKTIEYHHLGMSRDDGMDEHANCCLYGRHLVGSWLGSCEQMAADSCQATTAKLAPPKPLIINICAHQEMMAWMSMELVGNLDVIL
jgi:hypothetical protein